MPNDTARKALIVFSKNRKDYVTGDCYTSPGLGEATAIPQLVVVPGDMDGEFKGDWVVYHLNGYILPMDPFQTRWGARAFVEELAALNLDWDVADKAEANKKIRPHVEAYRAAEEAARGRDCAPELDEF